MAGGSASDFGTGGMVTKIDAARIATDSGCDMIIANAADFHVISDIMQVKISAHCFWHIKIQILILKHILEIRTSRCSKMLI